MKLIQRVIAAWKPPIKLSRLDWANTRRKLAVGTTPFPGQFKAARFPWLPHILAACDDPNVKVIVCQKHSGAGWTEGVVLNEIGRAIDIDPSGIIGLCPKEDSCIKFMKEKVEPMIKATPTLRTEVDLTQKKAGNSQTFKNFRKGGFLKLVASNSPINLKQTHVKRGFVEELDNCSNDVKGEGDSVELLKKRLKSFHDSKLLIGSTPTIDELSKIAAEYNASDKRVFKVPCHHCGDSHVLAWENVTWQTDTSQAYHEVYGHDRPDTAKYVCPHCGCTWTNAEKNQNVKNLTCEATAEFYGVAGFYINDIYSPLENSSLAELTKIYLQARHEMERGDDTLMIVFTNAHLGLTWKFKSDAPEQDELASRALDYPELTVPKGGLLLTAGVDVQHDRLAIVIRAWGRDEESWLVYWHELHGSTIDSSQPTFDELAKLLFGSFKHETGASLKISAISIDSSDGTTSDNVYSFVRKYQNRGVMAIKGSSNDYGTKEIFSKPKQSIDTYGKQQSKSSRYGLRPYIVGTHKAKDLIAARLKLKGQGAGRFHYYKDVRHDYYDQLLAEVYAPHKSVKGKSVWQKKAGKRNESLDCEIYALHAARSLKTNTKTAAQWDTLENQLTQFNLFAELVEQVEIEKPKSIHPLQSQPQKTFIQHSGDWL